MDATSQMVMLLVIFVIVVVVCVLIMGMMKSKRDQEYEERVKRRVEVLLIKQPNLTRDEALLIASDEVQKEMRMEDTIKFSTRY